MRVKLGYLRAAIGYSQRLTFGSRAEGYRVGRYIGGISCCTNGTVLLDADQEQPPHVDEVYFQWRFYFEDYEPAVHVPTIHLEWDGAMGSAAIV